MLKVGDKVKVRTWQSMAEQYGVINHGGAKRISHNGDSFVKRTMFCTCGQEVTITGVTENGYEVDGYSGVMYQDWMFEKMQ